MLTRKLELAGEQSARSGLKERSIMRARTDIELIVDGDIVDWSRVRLPADAPVIDRRF
jgi:hypothetical protein